MKIHLVGIGGIGMSGLARILLAKGYRVSGSDIQENSFTHALSRSGATIYIGHRPHQVYGCDALVYSSAIDRRNPELQEARRRAIPLIPRGRLAAHVVNKKRLVAVAGTHGKTTTTALIAELLLSAHLEPTILMGGIPKRLNVNSQLGLGDWSLIESDESDASFLELRPSITVITNIEGDHISFYGSLRNIAAAFRAFIQKTRTRGYCIFNADDPVLRSITMPCRRRVHLLPFGLHHASTVSPVHIETSATGTNIAVRYHRRVLGTLTIPLGGMHNMYNALAAIAVALAMGMSWSTIQKGLEQFKGVKRRLDKVGYIGPIPVFDDYAHHPTEIRATLSTLKGYKRKIIAIFQPHRYTRIQSLLTEFSTSFNDADILVVTRVYGAGEKPSRTLTDRAVYEALREKRCAPTMFAANYRQIIEIVQQHLTDNSLIVTLGAGDITSIPPLLIQEIR